MKISEIINNTRPAFSFEFFPPKNEEGFINLYNTIDNLKQWNPAFVSVTYGAGGSTRTKTVELVGRIKNEIGLESMAHLTCVGHSAEEIRNVLDSLLKNGIENVLALRGDPPKGETHFVKTENGFEYANELAEFIKSNYEFCIGGAGYPEGHIECPDKKQDMENLKKKVDAGAEFIITQLFFDNQFYFDFVEKVRGLGIEVPIIPGIMPVLNFGQLKRFTKMCGATIPDALQAELEKAEEDIEAVRRIGIEYATDQCRQLLKEDVPGIHFYTLNRSTATLAILENLKDNS
ncbi:MAG: methylenetetrahydrofolate reductase [NAD(P)H] [Nitrospinota bacterium]|nr:methylenetetrahydrofolate reductase [NAD(P)H] [Nitrospinota bacterium]